MTSVYHPSPQSPYKFTKQPIILRTACTAGFNRSATVREYLKTKIHKFSVVHAQYGADYGDYHNDQIMCVNTTKPDGFYELFGCGKTPSIQASIFVALQHKLIDDNSLQVLDSHKNERYKNIILKTFWRIDPSMKNVFVIINENDETIKKLILELG